VLLFSLRSLRHCRP